MTLNDIVTKHAGKFIGAGGLLAFSLLASYNATRPAQLIKTARVSSVQSGCHGRSLESLGECGYRVSLYGMTEDVFVSGKLNPGIKKGDTVDIEVVKYFSEMDYVATKIKVTQNSE